MFLKYKIITDEKEKNVKYSIHSSASSIAVSCPVKKPFEKGIKKIKGIFYQWLQKIKDCIRLKFTDVSSVLFGIGSPNCFV